MNIRKLPAELFARRLIQAGRADAMSDASRRRIFAGLGVPVLPPLGSELAQVSKVTASKGLLAGVGAMGAVGALSIWAAVHAWQPGAALADKAVEARTLPAAVVVVAPAAVVNEEQAPAVDELANAESMNTELPNSRTFVANGVSKVGRTPARGPGESVSKDSLNRELTKVDSARDALLRGEPAAALRMLEQYNAEFPGGALRTEAQVLRIEALAARGDRAQVARLGGAFLAQQPNGAYARRVRALMGVSVPARQKP